MFRWAERTCCRLPRRCPLPRVHASRAGFRAVLRSLNPLVRRSKEWYVQGVKSMGGHRANGPAPAPKG
jgi:hypothetical protein